MRKKQPPRPRRRASTPPESRPAEPARAAPNERRPKASPGRKPRRAPTRAADSSISPAATSLAAPVVTEDEIADTARMHNGVPREEPRKARVHTGADSAAPSAGRVAASARTRVAADVPEEVPITRRSSPLPAPLSGSAEVRVPPLPRVTIGEAPRSPAGTTLGDEGPLIPGFDLDGEAVLDVAPVGPTEARAVETAPESERAGPSAHRPGARARQRPTTADELEQQIRELEARLDELMQERAESASSQPASSATPPEEENAEAAEPDASTARELFATDYYLRQWGRAGLRSRSEEIDDFGFDPAYDARYRPLLDALYDHYFRVDTEGADNVPASGPCLIVSNHSGGPLPYDGLMLRTAIRREHPQHRELRWLAEDFIYYLPFVGAFMNRLGAVRACQENAERLLAGGRAVAVFPEGAKGIGKLYRDRYKLERFGRGGFIRLCLRARTPIVPCAIIGAEEANPLLYRFESLAKVFGLPFFPVTPTFPLLGPLGLVPAPTKWKIRFGPVMRFDEHGPEAAEDEILVGRLAQRVRSAVQEMVDELLARRRSVWLG